ncbi:MAG TPA: cupin domain-containing protein [Polyangiaceae bacterium]|jgi:hypothetical protein|nr:cupin domain-containing protein [Polyangiaceae bacterium]
MVFASHAASAMLDEWLAPATAAEFEDHTRGKAAWARPGVARRAARACTWQAIGAILELEAADTLVVARGRVWNERAPISLSELEALMRRGAGVCVRRAERHDTQLLELTASVARALGGAGHMQLFATPGKSYGFAWHYDDEDVFIVQTAGIKDYYFRQNTVCARVSASTAFAFSSFRSEVAQGVGAGEGDTVLPFLGADFATTDRALVRG